jgi:hypothetical protein
MHLQFDSSSSPRRVAVLTLKWPRVINSDGHAALGDLNIKIARARAPAGRFWTDRLLQHAGVIFNGRKGVFGEIKRSRSKKNMWDRFTHRYEVELQSERQEKICKQQRNAFQRVVQYMYKQHDLSNVNGGQADNQNWLTWKAQTNKAFKGIEHGCERYSDSATRYSDSATRGYDKWVISRL